MKLIFRVVVALACLIPFVLPALSAYTTTNPYVATIFLTLIPTFGVGFVLYGFLDYMMDCLCGGAKKKALK